MPRVKNVRQAHPDDFSVEDMKPTARAVKDQEMAIRRAYDLNAGLMDALKREGTLEKVKRTHRSIIMESKQLRDLFNRSSPEWKHQDVWAWTVDHWYSGGLKRSVEAAMENITSANRKLIKGKIDALYG